MKPETTKNKKFLGIISSPSVNHITLFIGRKGSGKTYLLIEILLSDWKGVYDDIIIVPPTFKLQNTVWGKIDTGAGFTIYDNFDEKTLVEIYNNKLQNPTRKTLLILDDNGEDIKKIRQSVFNKLISNSRHMNMSMVVLLQKLTQAPTILRSNADTFAMFSACSIRERESLYNEIGTLDKKEFSKYFNHCTAQKHSVFVASVIEGQIKLFDNFKTELIINNE